MNIFSQTLKKLREEAGFATAYAFFHDNDGGHVFKTSYRMYLLIEEGKTLPPFGSLGAYIYALRTTPKSPSGVELIRAWLKSSLGNDPFRQLLEPLLRSLGADQGSPLHNALGRSLANTKRHITPAQLEAVVTDKYTHLCWTYLSKDLDGWTPEEFAAKVDIPPSDAGRAMRILAGAKLLKEGPKGLYKCPLAGRMIELPSGPNSPQLIKKMLRFRDELISSGDFLVFRRTGTLRAGFADFSAYLPLISLNISAASTYASAKKQKDSALFAIDCKVVKIKDF